MQALATVGKTLINPIWGISSALKQKVPSLPAPIATPTRDDARAQISAEDALRKRRGGAADILTGTSGAEAPPGSTGKQTLGS